MHPTTKVLSPDVRDWHLALRTAPSATKGFHFSPKSTTKRTTIFRSINIESLPPNLTSTLSLRAKCLKKSQTSSSSLRSAGEKMLRVCSALPFLSPQEPGAAVLSSFLERIESLTYCVLQYSCTHKTQPQDEPDQVQGPMSSLPVHVGLERFG